jgi:hypothetical protein
MSRYAVSKLSVVLLAAVMAGSLLVVGGVPGDQFSTQQEDSSVDQNTTFIRVAHTSPDAPAVDVYLDDEQVVANVSFGTVGDYLAVDAGTHDLTVTAADDPDEVVTDGTIFLTEREAFTVAATGEVSNATTADEPFSLALYNDDALAPAGNASALRVVHHSPDAATVDVTVTVDGETTVLADTLPFQRASDYVTVPAGNYTVAVREAAANDSGPVVSTVDVSLEGETVYTAWATGYVNTTAAPADAPFEVLLTEDAETTITRPSEETATPTPMATETATPSATETPNGTATEGP